MAAAGAMWTERPPLVCEDAAGVRPVERSDDMAKRERAGPSEEGKEGRATGSALIG